MEFSVLQFVPHEETSSIFFTPPSGIFIHVYKIPLSLLSSWLSSPSSVTLSTYVRSSSPLITSGALC